MKQSLSCCVIGLLMLWSAPLSAAPQNLKPGKTYTVDQCADWTAIQCRDRYPCPEVVPAAPCTPEAHDPEKVTCVPVDTVCLQPRDFSGAIDTIAAGGALPSPAVGMDLALPPAPQDTTAHHPASKQKLTKGQKVALVLGGVAAAVVLHRFLDDDDHRHHHHKTVVNECRGRCDDVWQDAAFDAVLSLMPAASK